MATVPRYKPQVAPQALPGVRNNVDIPIEKYGGGQAAQNVTNAIGNLGNTLMGIAQEEKKKADETKVLAADSLTSALETEILHNKDSGVLFKRGENAFGAHDEAAERWKTGIGEIEGKLSNESQRMAFRKMTASRWAHVDSAVNTHVGRERVSYNNTVADISINGERAAAAANWNDPERVAVAIERNKMVFAKKAEDNGIKDPKVYAALETEVVSKTHRTVVDAMLTNGKDLLAKEYMGKLGEGDLTAEDRAYLSKGVYEGSVKEGSARLAEEVWTKAKGDLGKAQSLIKESNADQSLKDMARARVHQISSDSDAAIEQRQKTAYHRTAEAVYKAAIAIKKRKGLTEDQINKLPPQEREGLFRYKSAIDAASSPSLTQMGPEYREKVMKIAQGVAETTDLQTHYMLEQMASSPALREKYLQTDMWDYADRLDERTFLYHSKLQAEVRRGDEKTQIKLEGLLSKKEAVHSVMREFKMDSSPKEKTKASEDYGLLMQAVDREALNRARLRGKELDSEEIKDLTRALLIEGRQAGQIYGQNKVKLFRAKSGQIKALKPGESPDKDTVSVSIEDVPKDLREKFSAGFKRRGEEPTDEKIITIFLNSVQSGR